MFEMKRRIWSQLLVICVVLGCAVVPLLANAAAPVYVPSAPRAEALTAAEDIDLDAALPTVTVRGFLNFRTTVDGTVIVFTPASAASPDPAPATHGPLAPSSAAPSLSPRNDEIQHLSYTNDEREAQKRTELENEAHTPEDDRQNFRQRHLKPGFADMGTTPGSLKNEEPEQNLQKPGGTPSLPQYPTGLVTVLGGTHVKDGATTVFETKVIGTYIEGKYAQILQSTSQIIFPARPEDLSTPKPSSTKPVYEKSSTMPVISSKPIPTKPSKSLEQSSKSYRPSDEGVTKDYKATTAESRQAERRTDEPLTSNTVIQSSFKIPEIVSNRQSIRPTQSLDKTLERSSYSLSRRFRPTLTTDVPPEDENTVPGAQNGRSVAPRFRYMVPRRNTPSVRLNRFKVKLTARNDEHHMTDLVTPNDNAFDPEDDLIEDYVPLHPVHPAKVVYEKTTVTSEVTLHVGRRKSVRTLTITTSVPKTRHRYASEANVINDAHDISPANNNAIFATLGDEDAPPHIVVTRTYTTTEHMLKTSVVPIVENETTSLHTVTESFFILKLITGYKTLPASESTMFYNETIDTEFDEPIDSTDGLLDGAVLQPSPRQQIIQTPVPNGLLQASGSGREHAIVPYDDNGRGVTSSDLSNSLLSLGAALQQNPLAAVYLGLQQLNRHATLYSTKTKTSTYTHTDTIYSTKVVSFYDGRRTRTRTLSESISTTEKIMTSLTTTVEPYLNTQMFQQPNHLQQLLGSGTGAQLLAPPPQYSTITSTYTTVTTATSLSTRIYTLIYNAISTKFRTVTSTSLYETTITATTTSEVPITITAPPGGVFPFLG